MITLVHWAALTAGSSPPLSVFVIIKKTRTGEILSTGKDFRITIIRTALLTSALWQSSRVSGFRTTSLHCRTMSAIASDGGATANKHEIVVDPFCLRQFTQDTGYAGARIGMPVEEFEEKVNELYRTGKYGLVDGYAPFCKHIFVPNFAGVVRTTVEITPENEGLLRSAYEARTDKELPVLGRWFPKESFATDVGESRSLTAAPTSRCSRNSPRNRRSCSRPVPC